MRSSSYGLALFVFLLRSAAPTSAAPRDAQVAVAPTSLDASCPVSFQVRRNSPGVVANVEEANRHRGSQRIYMTLRPYDGRSVQSIELSVHAISAKSRLLPLASLTPDIDREFRLAATDGAGLRGRNIWVDAVSGILSVDLNSILYNDGSTWHTSPGSICHAVPNGFIPIDGAASH